MGVMVRFLGAGYVYIFRSSCVGCVLRRADDDVDGGGMAGVGKASQRGCRHAAKSGRPCLKRCHQQQCLPQMPCVLPFAGVVDIEIRCMSCSTAQGFLQQEPVNRKAHIKTPIT